MLNIRGEDLPITRLLPSMFTLLALCIGLGAIRAAFLGYFEKAIIFVMVAGFLDGVDGRIARALRSTSEFGAELDSLCDFVNFGIAPSFILFFWQLKNIPFMGWAMVLLMSMSLAIRLARFNATMDDETDDSFKKYAKQHFFVGSPAPITGILFLLPLMLIIELDIQIFSDSIVLITYLILICILAVSRVPTFSLKGIKISRKNVPIIVITLGSIMIGLLYEPLKVAIGCSILYFLVLPFSVGHFITKKNYFQNFV